VLQPAEEIDAAFQSTDSQDSEAPLGRLTDLVFILGAPDGFLPPAHALVLAWRGHLLAEQIDEQLPKPQVGLFAPLAPESSQDKIDAFWISHAVVIWSGLPGESCLSFDRGRHSLSTRSSALPR
jgi:hypothetical protein